MIKLNLLKASLLNKQLLKYNPLAYNFSSQTSHSTISKERQ